MTYVADGLASKVRVKAAEWRHFECRPDRHLYQYRHLHGCERRDYRHRAVLSFVRRTIRGTSRPALLGEIVTPDVTG